MDNNLLITLNDIKDRCFIYSLMLAESSNSLGRMKIFFKLPAIFISVVLSVLNSSKFNEREEINIINTVMNAFIALLIGVENTLQIDNKKQVFTSTKNKFEKLLSTIEKKLLDVSEPVSVEFVQNSITEFELIDDDLTFDIPKSIQNKTKREFLGKRTLPLILGGEKRSTELSTISQSIPQNTTVSQDTSIITEIQENSPDIVNMLQNAAVLPGVLNKLQSQVTELLDDKGSKLSSSTIFTDNIDGHNKSV